MYYTLISHKGKRRFLMVLPTRIELVFYPYQGYVMPLYYESMVGRDRFKLSSHRLRAGTSSSKFTTRIFTWYQETGSNRPRTDFQSVALPTELSWCIEFVSSCAIVIATIHPCNKLERDSVRHLGYSTTDS